MSLDLSLRYEISDKALEDIKKLCDAKGYDGAWRVLNTHVLEYGPYLTVWTRNITHNLATMADACGVYKAVWRPDENGYETAASVKDVVDAAIYDLTSDETFDRFAPSNGWGSRCGLIDFLKSLADAIRQHPTATLHACR